MADATGYLRPAVCPRGAKAERSSGDSRTVIPEWLSKQCGESMSVPLRLPWLHIGKLAPLPQCRRRGGRVGQPADGCGDKQAAGLDVYVLTAFAAASHAACSASDTSAQNGILVPSPQASASPCAAY